MTSPPVDNRLPVVIYKDQLLGFSETFIRSQGEALTRHRAYYAGARRLEGLRMPSERTFIINDGGLFGLLREAAFRMAGWGPSLRTWLLKLGARLIHAHFGFSGATIMPVAQRLGIPLIVTYQGLDATLTDEEMSRGSIGLRNYLRRRERLKRACARFVTVSDFLRCRLVAQGFPEAGLVTLYTGVDTEVFKPSEQSARGSLLFVGRLVEKKGVDYLIRAVAALKDVCPDIELIAVGDGPKRQFLVAQAEALRVNVRFAGQLSWERVRELMQQAEMLIVPSVTAANGDSEGLPNTLLEGQACGLPVVATRHAGIPEAVVDGATGILVPERDTASLARAIRHLHVDSGLRHRMGQAARQHMVAHFDLRNQTSRLEDLYVQVYADQVAGRDHSG